MASLVLVKLEARHVSGGTMIACRAALPHLRETRGNIVNTVSNLALQGHLIQAAYSSSKAAIIQMTRAIAASHGKQGVRCITHVRASGWVGGQDATFGSGIVKQHVNAKRARGV